MEKLQHTVASYVNNLHGPIQNKNEGITVTNNTIYNNNNNVLNAVMQFKNYLKLSIFTPDFHPDTSTTNKTNSP